jgi:hypothetical protein
MFIPTWAVALILIWLFMRQIKADFRAWKQLCDSLNPDWVEWKKRNDELEAREGYRGPSQEEPDKYIDPKVAKLRKAQLSTRALQETSLPGQIAARALQHALKKR